MTRRRYRKSAVTCCSQVELRRHQKFCQGTRPLWECFSQSPVVTHHSYLRAQLITTISMGWLCSSVGSAIGYSYITSTWPLPHFFDRRS